MRAYVAELLGTFLFFAIGFMAVQATGALEAPVLVVVPFAFGLGLLAAVYAFGHVSGGYFNPAVSLALALDRRLSWTDAAGYSVGQLVGGAAAALLVLVLFDTDAVSGVVTRPGSGFTEIGAFVLEIVLSTGFVLVILASSEKSPSVSGLVIPLALVAVHFAGVQFSGASVNPARSIGPAIVAADLAGLWLYIVAPLAGAVLAWGAWTWLAADTRDA